MIGWRIGWMCGNPLIVRAFADVKDNSDSGQFMAIQKSAAAALDNDEIPRRNRAKYRRRLEGLVQMLQGQGFECSMPGGSYFLYAKAPCGVQGGPSFGSAEAASQYLIREMSIVTVPWDDAGSYLRFSATFQAGDEAADQALLAKAAERMSQVKFEF